MAYTTPRTLVNRAGVTYDANKTTVIFAEDMNKLKDNDAYLKTQTDAQSAIVRREVLTAYRTYYVRTDGNNANTGLENTAGGAFLTIQKAIDTIASLDCSIYDVYIQVADGTYTGSNTLKSFIGSGTLIIQGNSTTPANVYINTSSYCFGGSSCVGKYIIKDMKLASSASSALFAINAPTNISFGNIDFGASLNAHIYAEGFGASITAISNYGISGGCGWGHLTAIAGATILIAGLTITISNTPALTYFAWCTRGLGMITAFSCTFTGSATGKRYQIENNSVCFINGASSTYFPGNSAGSVSNGGLYV